MIFSVPFKKEITDTLWAVMDTYLSPYGATDVPFLIGPVRGQSPEGLYGVINIPTGPIPVSDRDDVRLSTNGDDVDVTVVGQRELTATVDLIGEGADELAAKLSALLNVPSFKSYINDKHIELWAKELKVIELVSSQEVPNVLQSDYNPRFLVTFRLRTVSSVVDTSDTIDSVTGQGTTEKSNGDESVNYIAP